MTVIGAKMLAGDQPPLKNLAAKGEVPRRRFRDSDVVVSALALGGATFANAPKREALRLVPPGP